ncbi:MAG: hypothetical protein KTR19_04235 [Hyphomicrobiales bacterium]|nr:hypothetical protein [Hyphomicrobiales bacterium]
MPTIGSIDTGNINFKAAKSIFESNKQPNQQENTAPVKPGISGMTPPETRARGQVVPVQPETRERGNTLIFTSPNLSSRDAEANLYTNVPCPPPQQYLHGKPLHSHALKPLPELPNPNMSQAQDNSELLPPMPKGPCTFLHAVRCKHAAGRAQ